MILITVLAQIGGNLLYFLQERKPPKARLQLLLPLPGPGLTTAHLGGGELGLEPRASGRVGTGWGEGRPLASLPAVTVAVTQPRPVSSLIKRD